MNQQGQGHVQDVINVHLYQPLQLAPTKTSEFITHMDPCICTCSRAHNVLMQYVRDVWINSSQPTSAQHAHHA